MDASSFSDSSAANAPGFDAKTKKLFAVWALGVATIAAAVTVQFHVLHLGPTHHHVTLSYVERLSR